MTQDQMPQTGNPMGDADERAQSQAEGADKRDDGFVRHLLLADVREGNGGTFETRRMIVVKVPGMDVKVDDDGITNVFIPFALACQALGVRPIVGGWAQEIESTLRRNEGPPKNKGPWHEDKMSDAYRGLLREREEVDEAVIACEDNTRHWCTDPARGTPYVEALIAELVDESTAAMILADVVRVGGPSKDRGWTL